MTVTELRPYKLQHTEECDLIVAGRAALALLEHGPVMLTREDLQVTLAEYRKGVQVCGCLKLRLQHLETQIDRARRAGNRTEFAHLLTQRRELRRLQREAQAGR